MQVPVQPQTFTLPATDGLPIGITAWMPQAAAPAPVLIVLPGLKGFVRWGSFPTICERIAAAGCAVLGVDFSRNGVENFGSEITRIDLAEGNSLSRQVAECELLWEVLHAQADAASLPPKVRAAIDPRRVFVLGHSLGGGTALLWAARRPELAGVITWSSVARLDLWPIAALQQWQLTGHLNAPNTRTGQDFYLGRDYLHDVLEIGDRGILRAVRQLRAPLLILHGADDTTVPATRAQEIKAAAGEAAELHIIPEADHNYGAVHPFRGTTPQLEAALGFTLAWLAQH